MRKNNNFKIPGVPFSWRRLLGIDKTKREIAKTTGIPTTRAPQSHPIYCKLATMYCQ